jgi:hypothetical protein
MSKAWATKTANRPQDYKAKEDFAARSAKHRRSW